MITPSFSLTATERVLPKLALDFTTATLDPRVTLTRALNTATRVNSSGYIEVINANLPRFDYSPTSVGTCKGLLIEESRINICSNTQAFNSWTAGEVTYSADSAVSPDGTQNADKIINSINNAIHAAYQQVTTTNGSVYTFSVYTKPAGCTKVSVSNVGVANFQCSFDLVALTTASIGTGFVSASVTDAGNGWRRCVVTFTAPSATYLGICGYPDSGVSLGIFGATFAGNATDGIYAYGAQCELGSFATSYIPSVTAPTTRNADVATMTGTNFSSWFNATEGAFATKHIIPVSTAQANGVFGVQNSGSLATNYLGMRIAPGGIVRNTTTTAGAGQGILDSMTAAYNSTVHNVYAYKADNCAVAANANNVVTDNTVTLPTVDLLNIGYISGISSYLNGWVQSVYYWKQRIINAEVQAFSK